MYMCGLLLAVVATCTVILSMVVAFAASVESSYYYHRHFWNQDEIVGTEKGDGVFLVFCYCCKKKAEHRHQRDK